jgi:hypothetical protein
MADIKQEEEEVVIYSTDEKKQDSSRAPTRREIERARQRAMEIVTSQGASERSIRLAMAVLAAGNDDTLASEVMMSQ